MSPLALDNMHAISATEQLQRYRASARVSLDEHFHPSVPRMLQSLLHGCSSLTSPNELQFHLTRAERMFDSLRHRMLLNASHSPTSNIRIAVTMDGLYLGGATGAYLGMQVAKAICHGAEMVLRAPWETARQFGLAIGPLFQGPAMAGALMSRDASLSGTALDPKGRLPSEACTAFGHRVTHALGQSFEMLILGAALVRRSACFCVSFVVVTAAGASGAAVGFLLRVLLMNTLFSPLTASVAQTLNGFCGNSWPLLTKLADWTARNEEVFARMRYGLGHAAERDRSEWLFFTQLDSLRDALSQGLARLQGVSPHASQTPYTQDEINSIHEEISESLSYLQSSYQTLAKRYREHCIESYHFDPASFVRRPVPGERHPLHAEEERTEQAAFERHPREWQSLFGNAGDGMFFFCAYDSITSDAPMPGLNDLTLYKARADALVTPMSHATKLHTYLPLPIFSASVRQRTLAAIRKRKITSLLAACGEFSTVAESLRDRRQDEQTHLRRSTEALKEICLSATAPAAKGEDCNPHFYQAVYDLLPFQGT